MAWTPNHFYPLSTFIPDPSSANFYNKQTKSFDEEKSRILDLSTGDQYANEARVIIRFKCFLLSLTVPIFHSIIAVLEIIITSLMCISLYPFWKKRKEDLSTGTYAKACFTDFAEIMFRILFIPIIVALLELSALYGLIFPHNGRKIYANLERLTYGGAVLARCFQPLNHVIKSKSNDTESAPLSALAELECISFGYE
ncbi:MAG: hypothetical protein Q8R24_07065 [Legionellaceae bacterium]|nr:hypothetical protein [Legionellaceae bacterium]